MADSDRPEPIAYARPWDTHRAIERATVKLKQLACLEPDWDGAGSAALSACVVADAESLLLEVGQFFSSRAGADISPSTIAPIPGGGIYLEWRGGHLEFQVDVLPDGQLGFLFVDRGGPTPRSEEGDGVDLAVLLNYLARVLESAG
jgi:hypothetical protein